MWGKAERRDTLRPHMRIHTGEIKYQRNQCEARYVRSPDIRNHTLFKHTEVTDSPQFSNFCGKSFPMKDNM